MLWPLVLLYGGALVPAPAGGGALEYSFTAVMEDVLPVGLLAASMIWWRFYSYYIYVLLGAFAAGRTVMRACVPAPPSRAPPSPENGEGRFLFQPSVSHLPSPSPISSAAPDRVATSGPTCRHRPLPVPSRSTGT